MTEKEILDINDKIFLHEIKCLVEDKDEDIKGYVFDSCQVYHHDVFIQCVGKICEIFNIITKIPDDKFRNKVSIQFLYFPRGFELKSQEKLILEKCSNGNTNFKKCKCFIKEMEFNTPPTAERIFRLNRRLFSEFDSPYPLF